MGEQRASYFRSRRGDLAMGETQHSCAGRWQRAQKQMLDAFDVTREELTKGPVVSSDKVKAERTASSAGPATRSVVQAPGRCFWQRLGCIA